jgi:hypothetical protein
MTAKKRVIDLKQFPAFLGTGSDWVFCLMVSSPAEIGYSTFVSALSKKGTTWECHRSRSGFLRRSLSIFLGAAELRVIELIFPFILAPF